MRAIILLQYFLLALSITRSSAASVDGYSLGLAKFSDGRVRFVKDLTWAYERAEMSTEVLRLVGRHKSSVYFCNKEKGYELIVHLSDRTVSVNHIVMHHITNSAEGLLNGRNFGAIVYPFGQFVQISRTAWIWKNRLDGSKTSFTERGRDEWSVYLKMDGEGVDIEVQLDYHLKIVIYRASGGERHGMFPIKRAKYSRVGYRSSC